ncbi:PRC-barrel domain containing protein [Lampropedia aestuarii]|uniref:PRC-barrel domain containing protein n=2 Tax=Lampropedia aestuarii TaxID=2562762 RepID=A0A4V3YWZ4_9BURK|nr:PRC-barrel domain-containing protein [Lampropedia aestuarii]MDH5858869.1 PRC-barrel domain-containing protein [Lampropedia aestuarii]THJ33172.1 PRC-barrel domain containing protein [Lampropedia aestuarii]
MNTQKIIIASAITLGLMGGAAIAQPVAGTAVLGGTATEVQAIASGWSLKDSVLGKTVKNDADESVGKVEDVILAPDGTVSFAILSVGGFLGMGSHDVAIPVKNFRVTDGNITLPGATKDALKDLPKFEYAKK